MVDKMPQMKIYINYFGDAAKIETDILTPIQVGRSLSGRKLRMIGDDTGNNISHLNPFFNEVTGQYWVWKNAPKTDYVGFFHYRRLLDFNLEAERQINANGMVVEDCFYPGLLDEYGLTDDNIRAIAQQQDMILPQPFDVRGVGQANVYTQYKTAPHHHIGDYELAGRAILDLYPDDYRFFREVSAGRYLYPTNIFIMKAEIFEVYCRWVFPILFRIHREIDVTGYGPQERRAVGYIAERLFTVFVRKYRHENPACRVRELRRLFIADTSSREIEPPPLPGKQDAVSIVASTDSAYVPQMAALIASTLTNVSRGRQVEFIILDGGLTEPEQASLTALESLHPDCQVKFLDMSASYTGVKMHSYFSRSTLFRLGLPDMLSNRDKVVFLDTDMVVLGDIAELFDTEIGDNYIAAVPDLVMRAFRAMGVPSNAETGFRNATQYLANYLGMAEDPDAYFQAGTLIINLRRMREAQISPAMIADIKSSSFWFLDQDVLNKHCRGHVHALDYRWNAVHMDEAHQSHLTFADQAHFKAALERPLVVHYAGQHKPWEHPSHPLSYLFWNYLRMTQWYEQVLFSFLSIHLKSAGPLTLSSPLPVVATASRTSSQAHGLSYQVARFLWHCLPSFVRLPMRSMGGRVKYKLTAR